MQILKLAANVGLAMSSPQKYETLNPRSPKFSLELRTKFQQMKDYKLLLIILPDRQTYPIVKQEAELNVGCLTQCVLSTTITKDSITTTLSNILLKINAKCNGINHSLNERPSFLKDDVMIMGADVTHPPPGSRIVPSYAAVTASHDCDFFKYNMVAQIQPAGKEDITGLKEITVKQLRIYNANTKKKPQHIIFFRDGVSEGQFEDTINTEVKALKDACTSLNINYKPLITFIVVMKRHHTRLFPTNERDTYDKYHNVPAGTCVDTAITHPIELNLKDFYLASHAAIQGVTKPTKYCTIYDDAKLTYDDIEELTYCLCHMYTRCNRTVSYPAPTYYAHLAADRAKVLCHMRNIDWNRLNTEQKIEIPIKSEGTPMHFV